MAINLPIVSKYDDKGIKQAEAALANFGKVAAGVAAAATAAVAGIAVKSVQEFVKFDEQLNKSIAIMGDVSEAMRGNMAEAAREVARTTTFSADQAAESFFFLASAGLDAEQSIAAMPQVAKFAQAGMFDMALATDLATDAQSALGLTSKDAQENLANLTRVTDVFVRANTLANTSVEQLATAFTTKAGTALKTVNKSVEEGAAVLALFADQGVKGEMAGTQLTNTIFGLTDRALKVPGAFEKLGISVFDAEGNMRNFADIADDLGTAFNGMTEEQKLAELASLGFSKQARAGALLIAGNGDAIRRYEENLRSASGFTADVANKQLATPAAQFALLKSAITDIALEIGSTLGPAVGNMAGLFADLVNNTLPAVTEFMETRIAPAIETFMTGFQDLAVGLREGSLSIEEIFQGLFDKITDFFTGDGLSKLLTAFAEMRTAIINAFIKVIPLVVNAVIEILPAIVQTLAEMIPQLLTAAVETFAALVDAIALVLPNLLMAILKMLPKIVDTIIGLLPAIIDAGIQAFDGIVQALVKVIPKVIEAFVDATPKILDAIIDALPQILEAAFKLFSGIVTAILKATPDIIHGLLGLIPKMITTILSGIPKFVNAGLQLLQGLGKGIIDNVPRILGEAIAAIGNTLIGGVNKLLGIRSPSRVFMGIGEDVVAGFEKGLTDGQGLLASASVDMASTVKVNAIDTLSNMTAPTAMVSPSASGSATPVVFNVTVNAGMGADGSDIGRKIVDEIIRFERSSGRVFARA